MVRLAERGDHSARRIQEGEQKDRAKSLGIDSGISVVLMLAHEVWSLFWRLKEGRWPYLHELCVLRAFYFPVVDWTRL